MRGAYYNENDPFAAEWLRRLMQRGHIAQGDIDTRSISDVRGDDIRGYTRCHFFAGIGGWDFALSLAEWNDETPVWTGSCPCQPLSGAGQRKGHADERHLWPAFHGLIAECSPPVVLGEQVASKDGREWFAGVRADLEVLGYAVGASDLCAASVAAPHIRPRIYWVAHSNGRHAEATWLQRSWQHGLKPEDSSHPEGMGDVHVQGLEGRSMQPRSRSHERTPWAASALAPCEDGYRRIEPDSQPLADGLPNRMGRIRGFGNAIVPQVAEQFIRAYLETTTIT